MSCRCYFSGPRVKGNSGKPCKTFVCIWRFICTRVDSAACCSAQVFFSVDPRDPDWLVQEALAYDPFRINEQALSNFTSLAGAEQRMNERGSGDEGIEGHSCRTCASTLSATCRDRRGCVDLSEGFKEESRASYNPMRTYVSGERDQRQGERREQIEGISDVGEESGGANTLGSAGDPLGVAVAEWQTGLERLEQMLVFALASAKRTSGEKGNKREEHSRVVTATTVGAMRHTEGAGRDKGSSEPGRHLEAVKVRPSMTLPGLFSYAALPRVTCAGGSSQVNPSPRPQLSKAVPETDLQRSPLNGKGICINHIVFSQ